MLRLTIICVAFGALSNDSMKSCTSVLILPAAPRTVIQQRPMLNGICSNSFSFSFAAAATKSNRLSCSHRRTGKSRTGKKTAESFNAAMLPEFQRFKTFKRYCRRYTAFIVQDCCRSLHPASAQSSGAEVRTDTFLEWVPIILPVPMGIARNGGTHSAFSVLMAERAAR